ncbi:MAG: glutathione S-transferase [Phenylobacterium sp.]|jgi:glutathione S-transferase
MKLYGSTTSPYVRRLVMWLADEQYQFINIDIFSPKGRILLKEINPTLKIPMIDYDGQVVYDSGVIFRFLCEKLNREKLSWDKENSLTIIDAANDSMVELLLLNRFSKIDTASSKLHFVKLQKERTGQAMKQLNKQVEQAEFEQWDYTAIALYCLLDWVLYREMFDLSAYEGLLSFHQQHADKEEVVKSDPRG